MIDVHRDQKYTAPPGRATLPALLPPTAVRRGHHRFAAARRQGGASGRIRRQRALDRQLPLPAARVARDHPPKAASRGNRPDLRRHRSSHDRQWIRTGGHHAVVAPGRGVRRVSGVARKSERGVGRRRHGSAAANPRAGERMAVGEGERWFRGRRQHAFAHGWAGRRAGKGDVGGRCSVFDRPHVWPAGDSEFAPVGHAF